MKRLGLASLMALLAVTVACKSPPPIPDGCNSASDDGGNAASQDAQTAMLAAFDKYEVVGGTAGHGNKDTDDFTLALIRNPLFADTVNDIAVECGNSLYQATLDQYIAGADLPLSDVRKIWRNTTQIECGFSTFYEELFPLVRRINMKLTSDKQIRMLACDPPVDWSSVHSISDLMPFMNRDGNIASVMEKEVLAKKRKALMLFGINHMQHFGHTGVAQYENAGYGNLTFVVADHFGFGNDTPSLAQNNDSIEAQMLSWQVPSMVSIAGTFLAKLDPAYFGQTPQSSGQTGYPGVDGYLYVGRRDFLLRESRSAQAVLDQEFIGELQQRANSVGAPPGSPMDPASIFQLESQASPFLYDPPGDGGADAGVDGSPADSGGEADGGEETGLADAGDGG
jgi:hypothetical protein